MIRNSVAALTSNSYSLRNQIIRHLLMRLTLAFTLGWFGMLQAFNPGEWIDFVPEMVSRFSPVGDITLVLIHAFLLLVAATGILLGLQFRRAALLGFLLLADIILALVIDGGSLNLITRDIGILGLTIGVFFDDTRFWQLDLIQQPRWFTIHWLSIPHKKPTAI